jgi:hypothetical protein
MAEMEFERHSELGEFALPLFALVDVTDNAVDEIAIGVLTLRVGIVADQRHTLIRGPREITK